MRGPAGAFGLVSLQLLTGTFVFVWVAHLRWRFLSRGYFRSTAWVLWPLVAALAFALPSGIRPMAFGLSATIAAFLAAVYSQRPLLEWIFGGLAFLASLLLVGTAGHLGCSRSCLFFEAHAFVGMVLMGGVTHAMVLGHWYLNQARLPIEPLRDQTAGLFAALGLSFVVGLITRGHLLSGVVRGGLLVISTGAYWWTWLLLIAGTVVLGVMVWATVKQRSTQSATGLLYIAIVTALSAQFILNLLVLR